MKIIMSYKVSVHEDDRIVGQVEYNSNLDHWNGSNWQCGGTGLHLGISQLKKSGKYVLIHGTQWQGSRDTAEVVSKEDALQAILENDADELENWPELQKIFSTTMDSDD